MGNPFTRRSILSLGAGLAAGALARRAGAAEQTPDQLLDELMQENQDSSLDSGFDNSSRTVRLPKKTMATLSPSTAQTTEASIAQYEAIVAKGGWPEVPAIANGARVGVKSAGIPALRDRLSIAGDLELNSGEPDVFDSYVDAAVRRFQVRHGLHADGVVHDATLKALNVPADRRLAQLRTNAVRLKSLTGNLGTRIVGANIPAAQIEGIEN